MKKTINHADEYFDDALEDNWSMYISNKQLDSIDDILIEDFPTYEEMIRAEDNFYSKTKLTPEWDYRRPRKNRTNEPREREDGSKTFGDIGIKYRKRRRNGKR